MSNLVRIRHEGRVIGGVYAGKVAVVATYARLNKRSVIFSRNTKEECEIALQKPPWKSVNFTDIEFVSGG